MFEEIALVVESAVASSELHRAEARSHDMDVGPRAAHELAGRGQDDDADTAGRKRGARHGVTNRATDRRVDQLPNSRAVCVEDRDPADESRTPQ